MKNVLPRVGGLISKNYEAYKYLPDSIEEFLTTDMLEKELESVGFEMKYTKSFSMGISVHYWLHKKNNVGGDCHRTNISIKYKRNNVGCAIAHL